MKKYLFYVLAVLCLGLAGSCQDDDESAPDSVYLYSTEATVDATAGEKSLTIFTTCGWTATASEWITLSPSSGDEKGIHVIRLTYAANTTGAVQSGTVVIKAGTYTETFTLTQKAE